MTVTIKKGSAVGKVLAPPSKSMAHRTLICAALSQKSVADGVELSDDIAATLDCLKKLGADISTDGGRITLGGLLPENISDSEIYCHESGSTLRFLIPICLLSGSKTTLCGAPRLMERPLSVYADICREKGLYFSQTADGVTVGGPLKGGIFTVPGNISSQFISGLLFALPLCAIDSEIRITGTLESAPYIELTLKALNDFGIDIKRQNNTFKIKGNQSYQNRNLTVEGDWSNSAFLEAFNLFDGAVEVSGLDNKSLQGDRVYREHFAALKKGFCEIDLSACPDLAPIDFAVAAALNGARFTGTKRLKEKESDRAVAMKQELSKFGVCVTVEENTVTVQGGTLSAPTQPIDSHNDHRIVMATALLCTLTGGTIENARAVNKSFPDFFEKIESLGIGVKRYET